jgi:hypothetical protein
LAWSSIPYKRPGCFGLPLEVKKALRLEKNANKGNLKEKLDLADMFMQMKVIE